jgi:ABC-type histidine transport system ATPase subunit
VIEEKGEFNQLLQEPKSEMLRVFKASLNESSSQ